jgi:hypothetical protein
MFLSLTDVMPAAPLAASLVALTRPGLGCPTARSIAHFFLLPTYCPPLSSLYRQFRLLDEVLPAAPLAASLVTLSP